MKLDKTIKKKLFCPDDVQLINRSFLAFRMGGPAKKKACEEGHVQLTYRVDPVWHREILLD